MINYIINLINYYYYGEEEKATLTPHSLSPLPKGKFYNEAIGIVRNNVLL